MNIPIEKPQIHQNWPLLDLIFKSHLITLIFSLGSEAKMENTLLMDPLIQVMDEQPYFSSLLSLFSHAVCIFIAISLWVDVLKFQWTSCWRARPQWSASPGYTPADSLAVSSTSDETLLQNRHNFYRLLPICQCLHTWTNSELADL